VDRRPNRRDSCNKKNRCDYAAEASHHIEGIDKTKKSSEEEDVPDGH